MNVEDARAMRDELSDKKEDLMLDAQRCRIEIKSGSDRIKRLKGALDYLEDREKVEAVTGMLRASRIRRDFLIDQLSATDNDLKQIDSQMEMATGVINNGGSDATA